MSFKAYGMRFLKLIIATLAVFIPALCYSQQSMLSLGMWNLTALSGELKLGGLYGKGIINTYGIDNKVTTSNYYGGIFIKSSSYIWNRNFMTVDIDGGYYPESRQDLYLVSPNIYNAINTKKLHISSTLFPRKLISLTGHISWDNSYDSRENLTDIRTNSKTYGANLSFRNKYAPLTLAYFNSDWDSKEIMTGRDFNYKQKSLEGRVTRVFGKRDNNELVYTHNDYARKDYSLYTIRNVADNITLQDGIFLDSSRRSMFNSNIYGTHQTGSDSFNQFRLSESLFLNMKHNLTFNSGYTFYYIERLPQKLRQNSVNAMLGHQLFESLHSGLVFEYNNAHETSYTEDNTKAGLELSYTKKTFAHGLLSLQYNYSRVFEKRTSTDVFLDIKNEIYVIYDRILIKHPYIDQSSIQVKDSTGTAIYILGLDYMLTMIGSFIEVQRIPGGLIPENGKIFLYYRATQPGSYSYEINLNYFSFNYSLFNHFLDLYYKSSHNEFANVKMADNLLLDRLTQEILGTSLHYKSATVGIELDKYQSSLVPYNMTRYFLNWQGHYKENFIFSVNANWRDYKLPTEDGHRIYKDFNSMMAYAFTAVSKLDVTVGYQFQEGPQIDLEMISLRAKYSTVFRKITFVAGLDSYDRNYLRSQKTNYMGVYFQIIKKFKY